MRSILWAAVTVLAACSSGGSSGGDDFGAPPSDGGTTGVGTGVALTVGKVDSPYAIGSIKPSSGRYFLTVDVTLANVSSPAPVPAAFAYYSLTTQAGLSIIASPYSANVASPCAVDTSVTKAAKYTCTVAFEVPTSDSPAHIDYDDKKGDTASAMVSYVKPMMTSCETLVVWAAAKNSTCIQCFNNAASGMQCTTQAMQVRSDQNGSGCPSSTVNSCLQGCQSMLGDPAAYCGCARNCEGTCAPDYAALDDCIVQNCMSVCP